jgi:hypothetical protein
MESAGSRFTAPGRRARHPSATRTTATIAPSAALARAPSRRPRAPVEPGVAGGAIRDLVAFLSVSRSSALARFCHAAVARLILVEKAGNP